MSIITDCISDIKKILDINEVNLFSFDGKRNDPKFEPTTLYSFYNIEENQSVTDFYLVNSRDMNYDRTIAGFSLVQMPGCCGICISTGCYVTPPYRRKGVGERLNLFRQQVALYAGYTVLMCTDVNHNLPQKKLLEKTGWKDIYQFVNDRTDNTVNISVISLRD